MKTLYLTDLDGTLLRPDTTLSEYTVSTLNRMIGRGLLFSYATARSLETASPLLTELNIKLPVIVHNGMFLVDPATRRILRYTHFTKDDAAKIFSVFKECGVCPVTYSVIGGRNRFSYLRGRNSAAQREFLLERLHDGRARETGFEESLLDGDVFYFMCIDEENRLREAYGKLKEKFRCLFQRDMYSGEPWLEVMPAGGGKADAIKWLKECIGCDKLVCFGDQINDGTMFRAADECYAVENAAEELKKIATAVIGSNRNDGVARWLEAHVGV